MPSAAQPRRVSARRVLVLAGGMMLCGVSLVSAGDILRGGAPAGTPGRAASPNASSAQAAQQARNNAKDALARTTRAVEAVRQAQQNARRSSVKNAGKDPNHPGQMLPDVPDGLAVGGLRPAANAADSLSVWSGALLPVQGQAAGKTLVTVKQTNSQALLNWETFNVGSNTHLRFDQSAGGDSASQWIAFNKVNDPSGRPSQILGSISAEGQVYVINQNGIIFGGTSQVSVHTLVASSLPTNDNLISSGLLNQARTAQFLFSALSQTGEKTFTPPELPEFGRIGDVTVQAGARLGAPTTAANVGGRIALIGANVTNNGTIFTPDGQTILAAGLQVGFESHDSEDADLRGLDTYVGEVGNYAGKVVNNGLIEAMRGTVTLTGREIEHNGAIESGTSVSLNGRIDVRAEYNAIANQIYDPTANTAPPFLYGGVSGQPSTGTITLGPGSVLRVLPEWGAPDKVPGTELALKSQVNLRGQTIYLGNDAMIHAPSGTVSLSTGTWDHTASSTAPISSFVRSEGLIHLASGSMINVAGTTDAFAPLADFIQTVTLRASELADSPLLRDSLFRGGDITVDLRKSGTWNGREWVGTPLADLRGYLNLITRTVDQLTVAGGMVSLNSGGSVVAEPGSIIDVSAGWLNYSGGTVRTTRLMRHGQLIDIATTTPDRLYDSIYTGEFIENHPRWGVTRTYRVPWMTGEHYEEGYLSGAGAGRLTLGGSSLAVDAMLLGRAVSGPRQRETPARGGTIDFNLEIQRLGPGTAPDPFISPTPPAITLTEEKQRAANPFALDESGVPVALRSDRVTRLHISPSLLSQDGGGFAVLNVRNPDGTITVPAGVSLSAPVNGTIRLEGANIRIGGEVTAPSGTLEFLAYNISPSVAEALLLTSGAASPKADPMRGNFVLEKGAVLTAAGSVVDQRSTGSGSFFDTMAINGGGVRISAWSAHLAGGSTINVSGGVLASSTGKLTYGAAGSIAILAGQDLTLDAVDGGSLYLGSTLKGFSGLATGGTLSLQAQLIQIGGAPLHAASLVLQPGFFSEGGFSTFNLTGLGALATAGSGADFLPAVSVADGTRVEPQALSWLAIPYGGPGGSLQLVPWMKDEGLRAPVSLNLMAKGVKDELAGNALVYRGDVRVGRGARLRTDALGSISLTGDTVAVHGSLVAAGGSINLTGGTTYLTLGTVANDAQSTVYLAPTARLDASGSVISQLDRFGRRTGSVLPGGSISVAGNIIAEAGAVLDVSGVSGVLDYHPVSLGLDYYGGVLRLGSVLVPATSGLNAPLYQSLGVATRIDSAGGSIALSGKNMLFTDATLIGRAGGPTALGGTLQVSSGRFVPSGTESNTAETNLVVTQSGISLASSPAAAGVSGIGYAPLDASGVVIPGMGYFAADAFAAGGFSSLTLGGNVEFNGAVSLRADSALRVATGGVIRADSSVVLVAHYAALGQAFIAPQTEDSTRYLFTTTSAGGVTSEYQFAPTFGNGSLEVIAETIDIGTLSLQGIGTTRLIARNGDIRGNGTFQAAGALEMTAGQIYPTSGSLFNIVVYDGQGQPGSIVITRSGTRDIPLSAAGTLNLFASKIHQGGVLRAPFGAIQLGWDGSGAAPFTNPIAGATISLPATQSLTLAAGSETSVAAVDPRTGRGVVIPYGVVQGGDSWIAPSGLDITALGPAEKRINIGAASLVTEAGSLIDVRGGGDLFAYEWIEGIGGTQDILASSRSFAIIPGYDSPVAPFASFNTAAEIFGGDSGYANNTLKAGDHIYLSANHGLPAGHYTLLPARYALLAGAYLITPQTGGAIGSFVQADGSIIASGYRWNSLDPSTQSRAQQRWELVPGSVVRERAFYAEHSGNQFFTQAAAALNTSTPRLPQDSGRLVLQATQGKVLNGTVQARPLGQGRGALVDVSSPVDIFIGDSSASAPEGSLFLSVAQLNGIGAESLLIGGVRASSTGGSRITATTGSLTLDNARQALTGTDIILVAKDTLDVKAGSVIEATGTSASSDTLLFGDAGVAGSGNGLLVRVSVDPDATWTRSGVTPGGVALLTTGDGVRLSGGSITLDSTAGVSLSGGTVLDASTVNLSSGQSSVLFGDHGALQSGNGLVLDGEALASLQGNAANLNLLSYSSVDLYGTGQIVLPGTLRLSAGQLRGFNQQGGVFTLGADTVVLDNSRAAAALPVLAGNSGVLALDAGTIVFGEGNLSIDQFDALRLTAREGLVVSGNGSVHVSGAVEGAVSSITARDAAHYAFRANGAFSLSGLEGGNSASSTLGGVLVLQGASMNLGADIIFPSGAVTLRTTAGDLNFTGRLLAGGTAQRLVDVVKYTDGGEAVFEANGGGLHLHEGSVVDVSAANGGGDAGRVKLSSPEGGLLVAGDISGAGNGTGSDGSISVDVRFLPQISALAALFDEGGFFAERSLRVRTGDVTVDGHNNAARFSLSADTGSILVTGTIDASGVTGGQISLAANGSLILQDGSLLTVKARQFDNAGKGGAITLEAGAQTHGIVPADAVLDLQSGASLDLSVAEYIAGSATTPGSSAFKGQFTGTVHLRAPRTVAGDDLAINAIGSAISNASAIIAEGYKLYDLTDTGGLISTAVQESVKNDGLVFGNNIEAITTRLLAGNSSALANALAVMPGAEIINRTGGLTLGSTSSTRSSDWDLSTFRFGPKNAPGVLTLRAEGDLVFYNSLNDGFSGGTSLWLAPLMAQNPLLPVNAQSWSYRLAAGADFGAASWQGVRPSGETGDGSGSLVLGKNYGNAAYVTGANGLTETAIDNGNRLQVIRTGSGGISIAAARDVRLMNIFATIYTAGTQVQNPATLYSSNDFNLPVLDGLLNNISTVLGRSQQSYAAQYAMAGGNVSISAGQDIARYTLNAAGGLIDDTSRQIPGHWLYRRSYIDPMTGEFGATGATQSSTTVSDTAASTTWWVDYSNFFQGIGALGGGNVSLIAGNNVSNVDAVAPTNARAPGGVPDAGKLVELGGGDVTVRAGANIYGGTYYVERGVGQLSAGAAIALNSTSVGSVSAFNPRSPSLGILSSLASPAVTDPESWIPTLLFLGRGSYDVEARGDVLLGPVANSFLAPSGIGNKYWYKTWLSTYDENSSVNVSSLNGGITYRLAVTLPESLEPVPTLQAWLQTQSAFSTQLNSNVITANRQPWLRLSDASMSGLSTALSIMPPTLVSTALSGDISIVGNMVLAPSPVGTLELLAAGDILGLNSSGLSNYITSGTSTRVWSAASINVSDANPDNLPSPISPLTYANVAELNATTGLQAAAAAARGDALPLTSLTTMFAESGSYTGTYGVMQTKQALHDSSVLHSVDTEPVRLYALGGDLSGFTLYSAKTTRLIAARDIMDVSLYLQNVRESDVSLVAAARDIIPYNPNSALRTLSSATGNLLARSQSALPGDIQISGPGSLEILAGRHFTLGSATEQSDGIGDGVSSIGNLRNPFLQGSGADIILAAGIGAAAGLADSSLKFEEFTAQYVQGGEGKKYLTELGVTNFDSLSPERKAATALEVFYLMLRDAGRAYATAGNYDSGTAAIDVLFGGLSSLGETELSSRSLKTRRGGDVSILAPGGGLTLGKNLGNSAVPPGIITESGGSISIFTKDSVDVGVLRIFTLRGGNIIIWSSEGDVAAGSSSKTVAAAPPTRVIIDPQSADVVTDLAGLSTGGGIGVLATVKNVAPGDVDLIAPQGVVDAGDAGIRSSGNLTIAATQVLNAGNIAVAGSSAGTPAPAAPAAAPAAAAPAPPPAASASRPVASDAAAQAQSAAATQTTEAPTSDVIVEVIGYGGSSADDEAPSANPPNDEEEKRRRQREAQKQDETSPQSDPAAETQPDTR